MKFRKLREGLYRALPGNPADGEETLPEGARVICLGGEPRPNRNWIESRLEPVELERWRQAGGQLNSLGGFFRRLAKCESCLDKYCAHKGITVAVRWVPTQECPLGFWDPPSPGSGAAGRG
jgi:hypothetical protein